MRLANRYEVASGITADPDPNTTEPKAARVAKTPLRGGASDGAQFSVFAQLKDGTSIDATVWVRGLDDEWYSVAAASTVNDNELGIIGNVPPDSDVFVQLTAPAGGPTTFGFSFA